MIAGNREKEKEAQIRAEVHSSVADFSPKQMVSTGSFWVIYLMMTMVAFGGLVVTAQLKPMAKSYHADQMVIFGGMTALVLAIGIVYTSKGLASLFAGPGAGMAVHEDRLLAARVLGDDCLRRDGSFAGDILAKAGR